MNKEPLFAVVSLVTATAELTGRESATDYIDMVAHYIMSARGRRFFFGTGKRPFGMVNVFLVNPLQPELAVRNRLAACFGRFRHRRSARTLARSGTQ